MNLSVLKNYPKYWYKEVLRNPFVPSLFLLLFLPLLIHAGTTGKIAGRITDAETGKPLVGVNMIIENTSLGAATDINGAYNILNIPPGIYTLKASMIGYTEHRIENVRVVVDYTVRKNISLKPTVLEAGEAVTVIAERPMIQANLTSSLTVVTSQELEKIPTENFFDVMQLQAGVVQTPNGISIRGGRSNEVAYMVDGVSVTDPYNQSLGVSIENNAIEELQVISGTFNAEYGQAMSGIVNIVTKEGRSDKYDGQLDVYWGDFISNSDKIFTNIKEVDPFNRKELLGSISGPVPFLNKKVTFFLSGRLLYNEGYLYGIQKFLPSDSSNFDEPDPANWYVEQSGDGKYVPMSDGGRKSFQWKITTKLTPYIKVSYSGLWNRSQNRRYSHKFKWNPKGNYEYFYYGYNHLLTWSHTLSPRTFYTMNYSNSYRRNQYYVYKDPYDDRYVNPRIFDAASGYRFFIGGTRMGHSDRSTQTNTLKFDITSQVTNTHLVKAGMEYRFHRLNSEYFTILLNEYTNMKPVVAYPGLEEFKTSPVYDKYKHYPSEYSLYLQDKIELQDLIVNVGIRYENFYPDGVVLSDFEDTNILDPVKPENKEKTLAERREYWYKKAIPKTQISPRFGLAYPITDRGVIHFAYGHFLQIPTYANLYANPDFEVLPGLSTIMGNADLEPQRTISYEIGLQQELSNRLALYVTGYYKDIRNLLGTDIHETFIAGNQYALYVNRDYGNVKGINVSLKGHYSSRLSFTVDYTYGVAEGNASDPRDAYYNAQSGRESTKQMLILDQDQTHTLNGTVTFGVPSDWGLSFIGRYGSGLPYTPEFRGYRVAFENSERKPDQYTIDLRLHKFFKLKGVKITFFANVYNLFDRRNEVLVYNDTGRATYSLIPTYTGQIQGLNSLNEYLIRPDYYSPPREIKMGLGFKF